MGAQVPSTTLMVWVSPPPRHTLKAPTYTDLPAEWIRLYNRVAVDLGFIYPTGPAHHLDLYSLALGESAAGWQAACKQLLPKPSATPP